MVRRLSRLVRLKARSQKVFDLKHRSLAGHGDMMLEVTGDKDFIKSEVSYDSHLRVQSIPYL